MGHYHTQRTWQAGGAVCVGGWVSGRRWLWCIVVALHDPEAECNVSAVQYRGLPDLDAPAAHPTTSHYTPLNFLLLFCDFWFACWPRCTTNDDEHLPFK